MLKSKIWVDVVFALDAAAVSVNESVLEEVLECLEHKVWQVRLTAVETLGAWRIKAAILPLIAHLEVEQEIRIRKARCCGPGQHHRGSHPG